LGVLLRKKGGMSNAGEEIHLSNDYDAVSVVLDPWYSVAPQSVFTPKSARRTCRLLRTNSSSMQR
jgi:hypothetical protein